MTNDTNGNSRRSNQAKQEEEVSLHHRHHEQNISDVTDAPSTTTTTINGPSSQEEEEEEEQQQQQQRRPSLFRRAAIVVALCLCWYITSGINTIATKRFVNAAHSNSSGGADGDDDDDAGSSVLDNLQIMLVVTTLQLGAGAVISSALVLLRSPTVNANTIRGGGGGFVEKHPLADLFRVPISCTALVVPFLHAWGSASTNMGFTYGSASIVQIIKLLEPVETLLVGALVSKHMGNPHGIKLGMVLSIMLVVGGAMLALLSKGQETHPLAVMFSLMSGLALSCRNVLKKMLLPKHNSSSSSSSLVNFAVLSYRACLINLLVSMFLVPPTKWLSIASKAFTVQLMVFHAVYNLSSLSVLEYVTAPTHSLLNVGKRYYNIILSMFAFGEAPGIKVVVGIIISGIGSILYTLEKRAKKKCDITDTIIFCPPISRFRPTLKRALCAAVACQLLSSIFSGQILTAMHSGTLHPPFKIERLYTPVCQISFRQQDMGLCYYGDVLNFGDQLSPAIITRLLENHFGGACSAEGLVQLNLADNNWGQAEEVVANRNVCLFASGSGFHMVKNGDHIWEVGTIIPIKKLHLTQSKVTVHSAHGTLSLDKFLARKQDGKIGGKEQNKGHPGILLPQLYPEYRRSIWTNNRNKQHANVNVSATTTCFVAGRNDVNSQYVKLLPKGVKLISSMQNWRPVVEQIGLCDYVSSSSLYGLVIADAFGLPRQWFQFKNNSALPTSSRTEEEEKDFYFRYRNYFSSIHDGNDNWTSLIEPVTDVQQLLNYSKYVIALTTEERLSSMQNRTAQSFPFHLFQTVPAQR